MKKIGFVLSGIWCVFTSWISPIWLTLIFLYITGAIYQYDFSIEEGISGIIGIALFFIWLFVVLLPDLFFISRMRRMGRKHLLTGLALLAVSVLAGTAACGWDVVAFLTTPGGV